MLTPIGITGCKNAGKDTAAKFITEWWSDEPWRKSAFADPLRGIGHLFGFTEEQMLLPARKEEVDSFWGVSWRKFAQMVGTDMFRCVFRKDVWAMLAERRMLHSRGRRYIFTDVRFDDEAEMIKKHGGIIILIVRPGMKKDGHVSEKGISMKLVDIVVENRSSLAHFEDEVCDMVDEQLYPMIKRREPRCVKGRRAV